jgi:hypothetical protein
VMTLYVTPSLYYSLFLKEKRRFFLVRFVLWILWFFKKKRKIS